MALGKEKLGNNDSDDQYPPHLSHLDLPSFSGNRDEFITYRNTVLNIKAQRGPTYHKYLTPRLISNFKGPRKDDALTMELDEYLVPDGIEKLLAFLKKRLNIRELDMERHIQEVLQPYDETKGRDID